MFAAEALTAVQVLDYTLACGDSQCTMVAWRAGGDASICGRARVGQLIYALVSIGIVDLRISV
eukprot:346584-Pyramimonas_sp.AAC.1